MSVCKLQGGCKNVIVPNREAREGHYRHSLPEQGNICLKKIFPAICCNVMVSSLMFLCTQTPHKILKAASPTPPTKDRGGSDPEGEAERNCETCFLVPAVYEMF